MIRMDERQPGEWVSQETAYLLKILLWAAFLTSGIVSSLLFIALGAWLWT